MGGEDNCVPHHGGSRSTPGSFGSLYARMGKAMLAATHRQAREDDRFTEKEMRRVTLWLDCNSDEFGAYHDINRQRAGELVWPELDVDPENLQGVDTRPDSLPTKMSKQIDKPQTEITINILGGRVTFPVSSSGKPITVAILDLNGRLVENIRMAGRAFNHFNGNVSFYRSRSVCPLL